MTAPTFPHPTPSDAPTPRSHPPYAGPQSAASVVTTVGKVGPFVPAESRAPQWMAAPVAAVVTPPENPIHALPTPAVASAAVEMAVPASIPPYRPLRPTPIVTAAIRTPLYIPPIPTPAGEAIVEDEGVIEPQLVHTAEFEIPSFIDPIMDHPADESVHEDSVSGSAVASQAAEELPWIDSFLANTPATPAAAVSDVAEVPVAPTMAEEPSAETMVEDVIVEETITQATGVEAATGELAMDELATGESATGESSSVAAAQVDTAPEVSELAIVSEEWPLDEAAAEFRALRSAMDDVAPSEPMRNDVAGVADGIADLSAVAPLPEWSDDDLMDIMPIRHSGKTPLSSAAIPPDAELWAERANDAPAGEAVAPESTAEEAAHALEVLARRVRAGELMLPSYDPRMGEPAALVAALAALLGVKLR